MPRLGDVLSNDFEATRRQLERPFAEFQHINAAGVIGQKELLGEGTESQVYLAHDMANGTRVALKEPHYWNAGFDHEIDMTLQLAHQNIMPILACSPRGASEKYAVMPLLRHLDGAAPAVFWPAMLNIAAALNYIHLSGALHRDLKISCFYVDADGVGYLGDLGGSVYVDDMKTRGRVHDIAAPEFEYSEPVPYSVQSDMYVFAASVWAMIGYGLPYDAIDSRCTMFRAALSKDPSERPTSAVAIIEELIALAV